MRINSAWGKITAVVAAGLVVLSAQADSFWEWTRPFKGPGRKVTTLVITGNYKRPLALAQLIRAENRQPYLLVPAMESGSKDVFFCPVNEKTPALKLRAEDITRFVRLLNPEKVIILGDVRYVPEKYVPALEGLIPIVRIDCDDWVRNAGTLGQMLNLNYLERDYKRIGAKLDKDQLYRPLPGNKADKSTEIPATEIPAAAPEAPAPVKEDAQPEKPAVAEPPAVDPAAGEVTPVGSDEK